MELDFDDDDVPVWRSIVDKYRGGDQVLQGEAVKITHLFRDQKDNEKATEASVQRGQIFMRPQDLFQEPREKIL